MKANRLPYEYIIDGKEMPEVRKVHNIQDGAMEFIKDVMKNRFIFNEMNFSSDVLFSGIYQTGTSPNKDDLTLFANFGFYDEGEDAKLANPKSLIFYIFNLKRFKSDFLASRWKIGFMKQLFKLDLPYEKLYKLLLNFK